MQLIPWSFSHDPWRNAEIDNACHYSHVNYLLLILHFVNVHLRWQHFLNTHRTAHFYVLSVSQIRNVSACWASLKKKVVCNSSIFLWLTFLFVPPVKQA